MAEERKLNEEQAEKVSGGAFPPPYTVINSNTTYGTVQNVPATETDGSVNLENPNTSF